MRQGYSNQGSNTQTAGNNINSRALVVTQQDGSYDWSTHVEDQGNEAQAFMANISEGSQEGDTESQSNMDESIEVRVEQEEGMATSEWA